MSYCVFLTPWNGLVVRKGKKYNINFHCLLVAWNQHQGTKEKLYSLVLEKQIYIHNILNNANVSVVSHFSYIHRITIRRRLASTAPIIDSRF